MPNLTALVDEKIKNNRSYCEAMLKAITSGEVIAFIGAGLSAPLKYPSWSQLLTTLHNRANELAQFNPPNAAKLNALQYAEEISNHFKANGALSEFKSILGREFGPRTVGANCTPTHHRLVKLPFRAFVTTNYDACLEQALSENAVENGNIPCPDSGIIIKASGADRHRVSLFLRSIVETNEHRYVGYLHGRHDDTENIILTASAYANAYGFELNGQQSMRNRAVTFHRQLVWSLFATRRIVFFGCSMDDPYLKLLLDMVAGNLWERDQSIHFVALPVEEQSVASIDTLSTQFQRFGLQPVLFNNCTRDFSQLDQLLDVAIERCPRDNLVASRPESTSDTLIRVGEQLPVPASRMTFRKLTLALWKLIVGFWRQPRETALPSQSPRMEIQPVGPEWLEEINKTAENSLRSDEN
jgi:hypothetical protein